MATYWMVIAPGKMNEKYPSREAATEAGEEYLKNIAAPAKIALNEFDERGSTGKGRFILKVLQDHFHYVDTEFS